MEVRALSFFRILVKIRFVVTLFSPCDLILWYCLLKVFIIKSSLLLNYYFQVHLNGSLCSLENFLSKPDLLLHLYYKNVLNFVYIRTPIDFSTILFHFFFITTKTCKI